MYQEWWRVWQVLIQIKHHVLVCPYTFILIQIEVYALSLLPHSILHLDRLLSRLVIKFQLVLVRKWLSFLDVWALRASGTYHYMLFYTIYDAIAFHQIQLYKPVDEHLSGRFATFVVWVKKLDGIKGDWHKVEREICKNNK